MNRAFPIAALLTGVLLSYALYQALVVAPTDQLQGDVSHHLLPCALGMDDVRIFHHKFCRVRDLFVSPQRKSRCGGCGSGGSRCRFLHGGVGDWTVVGAPSMGIWWTWDVRLTSTLVLWLIYVSYLVLRRFSSGGQTPVLAAVLAVFGALDMPLVYFSIWFFRTQHPSPVLGGGGSIDPRMLRVWLINYAAFQCFGLLVFWSRYRQEILQRAVEDTHALGEVHSPR